jgi:hypothetical protein
MFENPQDFLRVARGQFFPKPRPGVDAPRPKTIFIFLNKLDHPGDKCKPFL